MPDFLPEDRFIWRDHYALGHPGIDDCHREFVSCVDALLHATDDAIPTMLEAFSQHARQHFAQEQHWMDSGDYPARDCHVDEHQRVLASLNEVQAQVMLGERQIARELAQALRDWFPGHAEHMDSALAHWLVRRAFGGAPLVFRRQPFQA